MTMTMTIPKPPATLPPPLRRLNAVHVHTHVVSTMGQIDCAGCMELALGFPFEPQRRRGEKTITQQLLLMLPLLLEVELLEMTTLKQQTPVKQPPAG